MVEVVIPWRGGCEHRTRALDWVLAEYRDRHPGWTVTVAEGPDGPWAKALAVTPAIERSPADVIVVADADVWTDGLEAAAAQVSAGAPWAIPHTLVHRLTEDGTRNVYGGDSWEEQPLDERPYPGMPGGGFVVGQRDVLHSIPLDPRFEGWGQEDTSWAIALTCLTGGPLRGEAPLIHFWHPPQPRVTRRMGSRAGWRLYRRYQQARRDPRAMRQLIEEGRRCGDFAANQPDLHADAA